MCMYVYCIRIQLQEKDFLIKLLSGGFIFLSHSEFNGALLYTNKKNFKGLVFAYNICEEDKRFLLFAKYLLCAYI